MQRFRRFAVAACLVTVACASTEEEEVVYRAQPGAPEMTLNRDQIAGVVHTNNLFEIEASRLALERSRNRRVREFAQRMITEHQHDDQELMEVHSDPENSPYAGDLQRTGQQTIQSLRSYSNASFDRAYMDNQITMHTWLLANLDSAFIPATSSSMRRRLESSRDMISEHLELARDIRNSLGRRNNR
jgi:putative membrane protein